jgi:L-aminopeptidase/D-esterase-like protein
MKDRKEVAGRLADAQTKEKLKEVAKPNSLTKTLRRTGVALILTPDPITAVPGVAMLGASFAMRKREPLTPASVFEETQNILSEMDSYI